MAKKNTLDLIAIVLVIIGGMNWGLVGVLDLNLVAKLFGYGMLARIVYTLVGLSALYLIYMHSKK